MRKVFETPSTLIAVGACGRSATLSDRGVSAIVLTPFTAQRLEDAIRSAGGWERAIVLVVLERLGPEDVRARTQIACEHLHRYELAARLCSGLRVADVCCGVGYGSLLLRDRGATSVLGIDNDAGAIETARRAARGEGVEFERADAIEFLEGDLAGRFDAVVMFEGLEHLPDPDRALSALRRAFASGLRGIVSIPNSEALGEEENPFHHTEYTYDRALSDLGGLGEEVVVLHQFAAEGSLIRTAEGGAVEARAVLDGEGEERECAHLIGLVNFGERGREASTRLLLDAAPIQRRYMRELEATNRRLWQDIEGIRQDLEAVEASASWRLTAPLRAAKARGQRLRRRLGRGPVSE
jgi:SAM-dependent methyltransferase